MAVLPPTQWAMLMPAGEVVTGAGDGPNGNVCGLMAQAIASMWCFSGLPRLFISGPAQVKCAADFAMGVGVKQRVWSFADLAELGEGRRLFVWSSGAIMGIGRTQEEVGAAVKALTIATRARGLGA